MNRQLMMNAKLLKFKILKKMNYFFTNINKAKKYTRYRNMDAIPKLLLSIDEIRLLYVKHSFRAPIEKRLNRSRDLIKDMKNITNLDADREKSLKFLEDLCKEDEFILNSLKVSKLFKKLFKIREHCHKTSLLNISISTLIDLFDMDKSDSVEVQRVFGDFTNKNIITNNDSNNQNLDNLFSVFNTISSKVSKAVDKETNVKESMNAHDIKISWRELPDIIKHLEKEKEIMLIYYKAIDAGYKNLINLTDS